MQRFNKYGRRLLYVTLGAAALLLAVAAALLSSDLDRLRPLVETRLSTTLGRPVHIGRMEVSIRSLGIAAYDVNVGDDPAFRKEPFVSVKTVRAGVEWWPLIRSRTVDITSLTLEGPEIYIARSAAGAWNVSSLLTARAPDRDLPALNVRSLRIEGGRVEFRDALAKLPPQVLEDLSVRSTNVSLASQFPIAVTAAVPGNGRLEMNGTMAFSPTTDPQLRSDVHFSILGMNLGALALLKETGMAGVVGIEGDAHISGTSLAMNGAIRAEHLKLLKAGSPATSLVTLNFAASHDLKTQAGTLTKSTVRIGTAALNLSGTYRLGTPPQLAFKITGRKMNITELLGMFRTVNLALPNGATLERGSVTLDLTTRGPVGSLITTGTVQLDDVRLANYDLISKLQILRLFAASRPEPFTDVQSLRAKIKHSDAGVDIEGLDGRIASIGEITGSGTIKRDHSIRFLLRAEVPLASALLSLLGARAAAAVSLSIQGTLEEPVYTRPSGFFSESPGIL